MKDWKPLWSPDDQHRMVPDTWCHSVNKAAIDHGTRHSTRPGLALEGLLAYKSWGSGERGSWGLIVTQSLWRSRDGLEFWFWSPCWVHHFMPSLQLLSIDMRHLFHFTCEQITQIIQCWASVLPKYALCMWMGHRKWNQPRHRHAVCSVCSPVKWSLYG